MKINIKEMYTKNKEVINYLIFGLLTFAVSMVTYYLSRLIFDYVVSNIISWILAVLFAYITNKLFVFESKTNNLKEIINEFIKFIGGRIFTLILETLILYLMVDLMHINDMIVKLIAQVIVITTNYILSKLIIFKKSKNN